MTAPARTPGWSYYGTVLECRRKAFYRYVMRLEPRVTPEPLRVGLLYHAAVEAADKGAAQVTTAVRACGATIDNPRGDGAHLYPEDERFAIQLATAYRKHYTQGRGRGDRLRPVAVEREFVAQFRVAGRTILYSTRYDLVARRKQDGHNSGLWLVERKTASGSTRGSPALAYEMDGQITGHQAVWNWLRKHKGARPVTGILLDFVLKSRPPRFLRTAVYVSDWMVRGFLASLYEATEMYAALRKVSENAVADVPQNRKACWARERRCEFFELCHEGMHMRPLYRVRKRRASA